MNKGNNAIFLSLLLVMPALAAKQDPNDVMKRNDDAKRVSQVQAEGFLETATGGDKSTARVKRFTWWRKLTSDGVHYKLMTRFHFPPEIKGEGILFLEQAGGGDPDVQLYLPSYKKIRRVESSAQSGSFMGSEFSYTDVMGYPLSDFKYAWQKEEPCGSVSCYVIESTPVSESVKGRAGYDRRLDWVRADNFMVISSEFYDGGGKLVKKLKAEKIEQVDPVHHKWMAEKLEMENLATRKVTTIEFSKVQVSSEVPDSIFTPRNLEKGL